MIYTVTQKIETLGLNTPPKSLLKSSYPKKVPAKINLPKTIPKSKISNPDFLFNEANKIWTLDEYVACQHS